MSKRTNKLMTGNKPRVKITIKNGAKAPKNNSKSNKSLLRQIGSSVGSIFGPIGSRVGEGAANFISHIMGQGDYKVNYNSLLTNSGPPSFSTNGDDVIIKHREFIADLTSSTGFVNSNYLINPGNASLFPWLSGLATNFEEYEFLGLIFEFKSTSGSAIASTNNALGTVMMATDYNVENGNFSTKRAMETTEFSTSASTAESFIHPIECAKNKNVLGIQYITASTSVGAVTGDPRFYYQGNLQIATAGQQAASITIGELWVSYQVKLAKPIFAGLSTSASSDRDWFTAWATCSFTTGVTTPTVYRELGNSFVVIPNSVDSGFCVGFQSRTAKTTSSNPNGFEAMTLPKGLYTFSYRYHMKNCTSLSLDLGGGAFFNNQSNANCIKLGYKDSQVYDSVDPVIELFTAMPITGVFDACGYIVVKYDPDLNKATADVDCPYVRFPFLHVASGTPDANYSLDVRMSYSPDSINNDFKSLRESLPISPPVLIRHETSGKEEIRNEILRLNMLLDRDHYHF